MTHQPQGANQRKCALVTGGTSGIGLSIAKYLVNDYDLYLIYSKNHEQADKSKTELSELSPKAKVVTVCCDITNLASVRDFHSKAKLDVGAFDVIVSSAGSSSSTLFIMENPDRYSQLVELNYLGHVHIAKFFVPDMVRKRTGKIISISSSTLGIPQEGHSAYAASKAALEAFNTILAGEVAKYNISVNTIRPGVVLTPMSEKWFEELKKNPAKAEIILGPKNEPIRLSEINNAVEFILKSQQVMGAVIDINNGARLLRM